MDWKELGTRAETASFYEPEEYEQFRVILSEVPKARSRRISYRNDEILRRSLTSSG